MSRTHALVKVSELLGDMWCVLVCRSVQYIDRGAAEEFHTLSRYPNELQKKITLLNYFRSYMSEHLLKVCPSGCGQWVWWSRVAPFECRLVARLGSGHWRRECACPTSGRGSGRAQPLSCTSPMEPFRFAPPHAQRPVVEHLCILLCLCP